MRIIDIAPSATTDSATTGIVESTQRHCIGQKSIFSFTDRTARRNGAGRSRSSFLTYGGSMYRYLTAFIVLLGLAVFAGPLSAQTLQTVSGYLPVGKTKVFYPRVPGTSALDTIYEISGNYNVSGF